MTYPNKIKLSDHINHFIHLDKMTRQGKTLHDQIKYFIPLGKLSYPLR